MKKLREEDFQVGRYKVRSLMKTLDLIVTQRLAYKVTTKRKHSDKVAPNLLNQNFNPVGKDEVWAGDVTYLKNSRRLDVLSDSDGFIFAANSRVAYR
jgi:putative transposase